MLDVTRLRVIEAVARHGSVTAAAKELNYSQPSVTHHLGRLEAETGAQLLQRVGRGIRRDACRAAAGRSRGRDPRPDRRGRRGALRPRRAHGRAGATGRLRLSDRGARARGRGRAGGQAPGPGGRPDRHRIHPRPSTCCARARSRSRSSSATTRPSPSTPGSGCTTCSTTRCTSCRNVARPTLAGLSEATWVAGCERCSSHLLAMCVDAGFEPRIGYSSDDMVVMQALVGAGLGVATQTGLSLRAHRIRRGRRDRAPRRRAPHLRRQLRRPARPARDRRPARRSHRSRPLALGGR